MSTTRTTHYTTAEGFLSALHASHNFWRPNLRNWLFRGQAVAAWQLRPTALRQDAVLSADVARSKGPRKWHRDQVRAEFQLLSEFIQACDEQGLAMPDDGPHLRLLRTAALETNLEDWQAGQRAWPPDHHLGQLALMQHYELPTRLLDWSRRPLVAAYFAVAGAAHRYRYGTSSEDERLCVWAIHKVALSGRLRDIVREKDLVELYAPAPAFNPNLAAQGGVFSVHRAWPASTDGHTDTRALDEVLECNSDALRRLTAGHEADGYGPPWLRCLTLPSKRAPRAMELLHDEMITASRVYAGFFGAAKAVRERELWRLG